MVTSWQAYLEKKELLSPAFLFWKVHAFPLNYLCSLKGANWAQHLSQCWFLFCKSLFRWKDSQPTNQIRFDQSKLTTYLWKITQLIKLPVLVYQGVRNISTTMLNTSDVILFFFLTGKTQCIPVYARALLIWSQVAQLYDHWVTREECYSFHMISLEVILTAIKQNKPWIDA